jgi:SAM-dependent methyltransferase
VNPRCALCGATCRARFVVNEHTVWRCGDCDLEFVWPTPPLEAIDAVYRSGYFTGPGAGYEDYFARERDLAARKAATRLDRLEALGVAGGRVLDVGCAAGFFLEAAAARGFDAYGVELSAEARAQASEALRGRIESSLDAVDGSFDVITLWDVLEHMPSPPEVLAALAPRLRDGGVLGIVLPVLGSVNTRLAPRSWDQYKPPEHLWFFSPKALRALLRSQGFEVVHEEPAWTRRARFVDPEHRRRGAVIGALRAFDAALTAVAAQVFGERVRVDSMAFYARRSPR